MLWSVAIYIGGGEGGNAEIKGTRFCADTRIENGTRRLDFMLQVRRTTTAGYGVDRDRLKPGSEAWGGRANTRW